MLSIVSRRTNIYYATDEDRALYWDQVGRGNTIKILDCAEGSKPCVR